MSGLSRGTRVQIPVVLRQQVDIVENETIEVATLEGLLEADVHQHSPVEGSVAVLLDDEDGVVQLLPPEERMHVLEEEQQVLAPTPERHNQGDALQHPAVVGDPVSSRLQPGEPLLQLLHRRNRRLRHLDPALCKRPRLKRPDASAFPLT
jgi:hypothetical protein